MYPSNAISELLTSTFKIVKQVTTSQVSLGCAFLNIRAISTSLPNSTFPFNQHLHPRANFVHSTMASFMAPIRSTPSNLSHTLVDKFRSDAKETVSDFITAWNTARLSDLRRTIDSGTLEEVLEEYVGTLAPLFFPGYPPAAVVNFALMENGQACPSHVSRGGRQSFLTPLERLPHAETGLEQIWCQIALVPPSLSSAAIVPQEEDLRWYVGGLVQGFVRAYIGVYGAHMGFYTVASAHLRVHNGPAVYRKTACAHPECLDWFCDFPYRSVDDGAQVGAFGLTFHTLVHDCEKLLLEMCGFELGIRERRMRMFARECLMDLWVQGSGFEGRGLRFGRKQLRLDTGFDVVEVSKELSTLRLKWMWKMGQFSKEEAREELDRACASKGAMDFLFEVQ